jgi:hypothetical protein
MDLVGYTALSSELGPEATARLLACLFTEIDRAALAVTQASSPCAAPAPVKVHIRLNPSPFPTIITRAREDTTRLMNPSRVQRFQNRSCHLHCAFDPPPAALRYYHTLLSQHEVTKLPSARIRSSGRRRRQATAGAPLSVAHAARGNTLTPRSALPEPSSPPFAASPFSRG